MKFLLDGIGKFMHGYEGVFWLKECFTVGIALLVFLFVWMTVVLGYGKELLLLASSFIGIACIMLGDMEYWSSNDILKLVAPITLFLLAHRKKQESDVLLFVFLVPYFFTSYAFHIYRDFYYGGGVAPITFLHYFQHHPCQRQQGVFSFYQHYSRDTDQSDWYQLGARH